VRIAGPLHLVFQCFVFGLAVAATQFDGSTAAEEKDRPMPSITLSPAMQTRCLEILRSGLRADDFWPSMHAAEALTLAGHGQEVRRCLSPKLETETDDRHRCGLARELVRAGDLSRTAILLEILAKEEPYGHVHACESLFKCGRTGDGRLLRAAMDQDENPTLAIMAAAALGRDGSADAMKRLREKLAAKDPEVNRIAAWVLGQIGEPCDVPQLRANLAALTDPIARSYHEHALACLKDAEGLRALARDLKSDDAALRVHAAAFAGDAGAVHLADELTSLLDDPDLDVRIRAAQSLLVLSQPDPRSQP